MCDDEGFSWSMLEAMKVICKGEGVEMTEQDCKKLLATRGTQSRLHLIDKMAAVESTILQVCHLVSAQLCLNPIFIALRAYYVIPRLVP